MNNDLTLAMRLYADTARFVSGMTGAERSVSGFVGNSKKHLSDLQSKWQTLQNIAAGAGTLGMVAVGAANAGRLDKQLTQIGQTAGVSAKEVAQLRKELFRMAGETGESVDSLREGFAELVAGGLEFDESLATIDAINKAMVVTGANGKDLAAALNSASVAFQFDLAQPGKALDLLGKMTMSGRLGRVELQNLSTVLSAVGGDAARAGMSFEDTISMSQVLAKSGLPLGQLDTLQRSTLRMFTNENYLQTAQAATGVQFRDSKGKNRDVIDVFEDMSVAFKGLRTDAERGEFVMGAFGKMDEYTTKGVMELLKGDSLKMLREFSQTTRAGGDTITKSLPDAMNNAVNQAGRLKAKMQEAADAFSKPVAEAFANATGFVLDKPADGGLGLSGGQIAGLGGAAALSVLLGGMILKRRGGAAVGAGVDGVLASVRGLGAGVATGKALEQIGVQPVYVVNMPSGGIGGDGLPDLPLGSSPGGRGPRVFNRLLASLGLLGSSNWGTIAAMGRGAMLAAGGLVGAAGAGGYGLGTLAYQGLAKDTQFAHIAGGTLATILARLGNNNARNALQNEFGGRIVIQVEEGRVRSVKTSTTGGGPQLDASRGVNLAPR